MDTYDYYSVEWELIVNIIKICTEPVPRQWIGVIRENDLACPLLEISGKERKNELRSMRKNKNYNV